MRNRRFRGGHPAHEMVDISEKQGLRILHLGGGRSVQSAMRLRDPFGLALEYTRQMMAFLIFNPAPRTVTMVGLGGGSLAKFLWRNLPDTRTTVLELNPQILAAARSWFELPPDDERLNVVLGDGVAWVNTHPESAEILLIDAFSGHDLLPDLLDSAFYHACHRLLKDQGVAVVNLWGGDARLPDILAALKTPFGGQVLLLPCLQDKNVIALAFKGPLKETRAEALKERALALQKAYNLDFAGMLETMLRQSASDKRLTFGESLNRL